MTGRRSALGPGVRRWVIAVVAGVALQVPVFAGYLLQTGVPMVDFLRQGASPNVMVARFVEQPPAEVKKPVEEPEPPPEGQYVTAPPPEVEPEPKPDEEKPKYLADRKVRVKKQTKSRRSKRPAKSKTRGKVDKPLEPSPLQAADATSEKATKIPRADEAEPQLPEPKQKLPPADSGQQVHESLLKKGDKAKLFRPSTSQEGAVANLQGIPDSFSSDDHLPEIKDRSKSTQLNADKSRFSDFFSRVMDAVRRHWHPNQIYRRRDPTGKVYGVKDRHTVLKVTLTPAGRIKRLTTRKHSGLDFMDEEARRAMRRAQPFVNPPKGLVKQGEINFIFGFYFEISAGKRRFKWRRL